MDISVTETMKTMVCLYNSSLLLNTENMVRTYQVMHIYVSIRSGFVTIERDCTHSCPSNIITHVLLHYYVLVHYFDSSRL